MSRFCSSACLAVVVFILPIAISRTEALPLGSDKRTYRIMDHMAREELTEAEFSPDGQAVAFVSRRAPNSQLTNALLLPNTRDDVWLQDAPGKLARNLTEGAGDASGWWMPRWSPDGERLAFASSRGGTVTLWAWERTTNRVRQLSLEGVAGGPYPYSEAYYQWLDAQHILFIGPPAGERVTPVGQSGYVRAGRGVEQAEAVWAKAKRGELTASVVDSLQFKLPQRRPFVLDVQSGVVRPISTTVRESDAQTWWLAPNAKAIAFVQPKPATYGILDRLKQGYPASIELRLLDGSLPTLDHPLPANVVTTSLRWSSDGQELAFFALGDKLVHRDAMYPNLQYMDTRYTQEFDIRWPKVDSKEYPGQLWRVNLRSGEVRTWGTGDLDLGQAATPPEFDWTMSGELLFKGTRVSDRGKVSAPLPTAWWVLGRDGGLRVGDESLKALSAEEAREREVSAQRAAFEKRIKSPSQMMAFSNQSRSGIYLRSGHRDGDVLMRVSEDGTSEEFARANTFRRAIAPFKEQLIEYTCMNGEKCVAKLTYPHGYQPGRRYPVVVDSDIGATQESGPHLFKLTDANQWNNDAYGRSFAAGGYIYLWASMPTRAGMDQTGRANLLNFTAGILPAVEKVVQLGIADAERVFLYGASSMGYGVFGLITQTSRFKAAAAEIGWVDQASNALSLGMLRRYSDNPFDRNYMGAAYSYVHLPFWRNGDHLRRNSPLTYVDRVQTPLLILDGDFDDGFMENAEMFFSALVQQRKPARFVRYWGETHGNQTPVNFLNGFQQIFAWYDQWGDIARDDRGNILFDKNGNVRSRGDAPPLTAANYEHYDVFGPGGEAGTR